MKIIVLNDAPTSYIRRVMGLKKRSLSLGQTRQVAT
jgi:hypothetical protein